MAYVVVGRYTGRVALDRGWGRALRVAVHERDNFTCQGCGWRPKGREIPAGYDGRHAIGTWRIPADRILHLDHVYPRSLGGLPVLDNLQTLCEPCNARKAARVVTD